MSEEQLERKKQLLYLARQSRMKWVDEAKVVPSRPASSAAGNGGTLHAGNSEGSSILTPELRKAIPAAESVHAVLQLLSEIVGDGEVVDFESVVKSVLEDTDASEELERSIDPLNYMHEGVLDHFSLFIARLKHSLATDILKSIQQFCAKFEAECYAVKLPTLTRRRTPEEEHLDRAESLVRFLQYITDAMRECALWSNTSDSDWEQSKDNVEKFLYIKLHKLIYGSDADDDAADSKLHQRIQSLQFLLPEHLDLKAVAALPNPQSIFTIPSRVLSEINDMLSPQDKLLCVKKCSVAIATELKRAHKDGTLPGADEFLPMMILVIKEANPPNLLSTVKYLQRYTNPKRLISEYGYLLTHFVSAVNFLENVDALALTISPEEFDTSMKRCKEAAKESLMKRKNAHTHAGEGIQWGYGANERSAHGTSRYKFTHEDILKKLSSSAGPKKSTNTNTRTGTPSIMKHGVLLSNDGLSKQKPVKINKLEQDYLRERYMGCEEEERDSVAREAERIDTDSAIISNTVNFKQSGDSPAPRHPASDKGREGTDEHDAANAAADDYVYDSILHHLLAVEGQRGN